MKDQFFKYIHELQDTITSKLELIDGSAVFKEGGVQNKNKIG